MLNIILYCLYSVYAKSSDKNNNVLVLPNEFLWGRGNEGKGGGGVNVKLKGRGEMSHVKVRGERGNVQVRGNI